MAALELRIFRGKRAPKSENDNSEDSEVEKNIHFGGLVKDDKSVAGFFFWFPPISNCTE